MMTVECPRCGLVMTKLGDRPDSEWSPYQPYWNPHTDERGLCKPDYWRSLYDSEPPTSWLPRDMGTQYPGLPSYAAASRAVPLESTWPS